MILGFVLFLIIQIDIDGSQSADYDDSLWSSLLQLFITRFSPGFRFSWIWFRQVLDIPFVGLDRF